MTAPPDTTRQSSSTQRFDPAGLEAGRIAQRLASSPWFPLPGSETHDGRRVRDSVAHVEVDGNVVTICVTDHDGVKREYQATVALVSDSRTAPADPVLPAPAGTAHTHKSVEESR
jgi:hypothetical protein